MTGGQNMPTPDNPATPPFNPNAPQGLLADQQAGPQGQAAPPPPQAAQGLLGPQAPPQQGLMGYEPNPNTPELNNPANVARAGFSFEDEAAGHEHSKGVRGKVRHFLGIDRMDPEERALVTGDQARRTQPGIMESLFTEGGGRAARDANRNRLLGLQDTRKGRETTQAVEQQREQAFESVTAPTPEEIAADPQGARQRYLMDLARAQASGRLPDRSAAQTVNAANVLAPSDFQPRAAVRRTFLNEEDGNHYEEMWDPTTQRPVPGTRNRIPKPNIPVQFKEEVSSDGLSRLVAVGGAVSGDDPNPDLFTRRTGIQAPTGGGGAAELRLINGERSLAYDDAQLSMQNLMDGNVMREPPGNFDRLATQTEWLNWAASGKGQVYVNNVNKLIRAWVVLIEGKRMSDADARVNALQRGFRFGDKEVTDQGKKITLQSMARSITALGAGGKVLHNVPGEATTAPLGSGRYNIIPPSR